MHVENNQQYPKKITIAKFDKIVMLNKHTSPRAFIYTLVRGSIMAKLTSEQLVSGAIALAVATRFTGDSRDSFYSAVLQYVKEFENYQKENPKETE